MISVPARLNERDADHENSDQEDEEAACRKDKLEEA